MTVCRRAARLLLILLLTCSLSMAGSARIWSRGGGESSAPRVQGSGESGAAQARGGEGSGAPQVQGGGESGAPQVQGGGGSGDLQLQAKAAVLMDMDTGRLLFSKNPSQHMPIASLTKVMTALLVLENGVLDQKVYVSQKAAATGESTIWLQPGEIFSRRELLYALLLSSANDAAVALAESVSGTEENFVDLMNRRARELQLHDTHFSNSHGLEAPDHYSSAYDLALLTRQAMADPVFRQIVDTKTVTLPWPGHPWPRLLINKDRLLFRYPGAIGGKTGYTREAGNCLIGAAQRGSLRLIAVVLHSPDDYGDTEKLLNYGFDHYRAVDLDSNDQVSTSVRIVNGLQPAVALRPDFPLVVAVLPGEEQALRCQRDIPASVPAPVSRGTVLGGVRIYLGDCLIGSVNLTAAADVAARPTPWSELIGFLKLIWSRLY